MSRIIFDKDAVTNPKFGSVPSERSLDELLGSGILLVKKPRGPTSHQLTAWIRNILGISKIGHGGTLDPMATGLLTILCGRATRLTDIILKGDKRYISIIRFGRDIDSNELEELLNSLVGEIYNVPPKESAVKVQVRTRTITSLSLLDFDSSSRIAAVEISCVAGTYIRTLTRDIGLLLNTSCEMLELHRDRTSIFDESMACNMHQLADAIFLWKEHNDERSLRKLLTPVETILAKIPSIMIKDGAVAAMTHGAPLARPGVVNASSGISSGSLVVISSMKGEAVAVANTSVDIDEVLNMTKGQVAVAKSVLMPTGIYPQNWSKQN
ncbi:MAG: RNA-guided pseudouridylation complex pseudouridine synthase subunit Cbf5 [Candidatus Thalassarchaeum sp.]|nr:RNA-guided pseudouridylation complex pseudouridine synthase subunit Cbf5 [Candidatus Thalassarchaeum sp.]MDB3855797.1 RNA-guided pseudouridylation complex pseudouridine synthase subunit Cbf5 [Euryarchaeota archaeon]